MNATDETRPTVLIVEDDDETREALRELLEEHGYRVLHGRNGAEAKEHLRRQPPPACIVLDLWMPVMDGWTFASELKGSGFADIPVVVITAAEPHWGYPSPPSMVMRKPLDPHRLLRLVNRVAQ